jgi:hypothetical protein
VPAGIYQRHRGYRPRMHHAERAIAGTPYSFAVLGSAVVAEAASHARRSGPERRGALPARRSAARSA